jgi:hypothetical protein
LKSWWVRQTLHKLIQTSSASLCILPPLTSPLVFARQFLGNGIVVVKMVVGWWFRWQFQISNHHNNHRQHGV